MTQALIELSDLGFSWPGHPPLLDIPAFRLEPGQTLFLKGPSGSGKTTLLGLLGGVQKPDRGSIRLLGQELESPLFGDKPDADDHDEDEADKDGHEHHHDHSEIHAHYQFSCATPGALSTLNLTNIFKTFPATQKIQVQLISASGQQGAEVTAKSAALKF